MGQVRIIHIQEILNQILHPFYILRTSLVIQKNLKDLKLWSSSIFKNRNLNEFIIK